MATQMVSIDEATTFAVPLSWCLSVKTMRAHTCNQTHRIFCMKRFLQTDNQPYDPNAPPNPAYRFSPATMEASVGGHIW